MKSPLQTTLTRTSGIAIPRIGLGCATFGREVDEAQSFMLLDYAFERGITLLDTAEAYGGGQARQYRQQYLGIDDVREVTGELHSSEKIIGRWLTSRKLRKEVVIQTKVTSCSTPLHVSEALDRSLERLQTDYVDIYLLHKYDPETPPAVSVSAMDMVVQAQKARTVGCSNITADQLRHCIEHARKNDLAQFEVVQPVYNLARREIELDLIPLCQQEHMAITSYSPLGAGFLAGKYQAGTPFPKGSRFDVIPAHGDEYFSPKNFKLVDALRILSERSGISMTRLAMSWVFSNRAIQCVLIGARTTAHIDNAIQSLESLPDLLLDEMNGWS
ncbi:MAG: aldo/keto reductase [Acidobacteria bacterium]|nr:aldo/keto reductase [Acidobacteriota bacterium]